MSAKIIDGKSIASDLLETIRNTISVNKSNGMRNPCLAVILIGDNPASHVYVKNKKLACEKVGIKSLSYDFKSSISEQELLTLVKDINLNPEIDGILIQSPLPNHIDEDKVINAIDPRKDVDGFHPLNIGLLTIRQPKLRPCTPYGVIKMLKASNINLEGLDATIVGVSNNVGRPMALELLIEKCTILRVIVKQKI